MRGAHQMLVHAAIYLILNAHSQHSNETMKLV